MSHIVSYYREKSLEGDLNILVRDFETVISLILRNLKTKGEKNAFCQCLETKEESTLGKKDKFHHSFRNKQRTKKSRRKNNKGERDERRRRMNKMREEVSKRKFQETRS